MVKALIIIDMSKSYKLDTYNAQEILDNQVKLIDAFNAKNLPVIVVTGDPDAPSNPVMKKLWGNESEDNAKNGLNDLVPEIANAKYSKLIKKAEYDAFLNTDLKDYCDDNDIDELFFCGVYSGACVYFSAAGAAMRHIQPYLITDAASTEKPEWHEKNCNNFKTVIGPLITTDELLNLLN